MTQLRSVTCHMGSSSVTCYPTQVNTPRLPVNQSIMALMKYDKTHIMTKYVLVRVFK